MILATLDFFGATLSLISTYYFTQAKNFSWIIGLFAILLNSILYWQKGIYGQFLLEIFYSFSMIYGWLYWQSSRGLNSKIRSLRWSEAFFYAIIACCGIFIFSKILINYTDSELPYWDAASTVLSLLAQWMLCLKIIQCWFLWFFVDVMIASLQYYKGLPFHSMVFWIYLSLAVIGYCKWKKIR